MELHAFSDEYAVVAPLFGLTADELRARDRGRGEVRRWWAIDDGTAVAAADVVERPDGRRFLALRGDDPAARARLAAAVRDRLGSQVRVNVDGSDTPLRDALAAAGFRVELVSERFRVRFDDALRRMRRSWEPSAVGLHPADHVDRDRLFDLDNEIRNDVPGTDGWQGNRAWFDAELAESPPFDASGYWVAIDDRDGRYAGLCRMWRNPDGPRLGLIGVARPYRRTGLAAALLQRTLEGSAGWGWDSFTTEASTTNRETYPVLTRIAAERLGRVEQWVLGQANHHSGEVHRRSAGTSPAAMARARGLPSNSDGATEMGMSRVIPMWRRRRPRSPGRWDAAP